MPQSPTKKLLLQPLLCFNLRYLEWWWVVYGVRVSWCRGHSSQGSRVMTAMTGACSSFDLSFVSCNSSWSNVVSPGFGTKQKIYTRMFAATNRFKQDEFQIRHHWNAWSIVKKEWNVWRKYSNCSCNWCRIFMFFHMRLQERARGTMKLLTKGLSPDQMSVPAPNGRRDEQQNSATVLHVSQGHPILRSVWNIDQWSIENTSNDAKAHGLRWTKFFSFLCELPTRLSRHTKICFSFLQLAFSCFFRFCQSLELSCSEFQREALCGRE